jgi:hypothetical protein
LVERLGVLRVHFNVLSTRFEVQRRRCLWGAFVIVQQRSKAAAYRLSKVLEAYAEVRELVSHGSLAGQKKKISSVVRFGGVFGAHASSYS